MRDDAVLVFTLMDDDFNVVSDVVQAPDRGVGSYKAEFLHVGPGAVTQVCVRSPDGVRHIVPLAPRDYFSQWGTYTLTLDVLNRPLGYLAERAMGSAGRRLRMHDGGAGAHFGFLFAWLVTLGSHGRVPWYWDEAA